VPLLFSARGFYGRFVSAELGRAPVGKSPRVVAAAVIYAATCTPARAAAEALGVSPITVKQTARKLRLAVKMCARRSILEQRRIEVHA